MGKVIKLKQSDIFKIVENIIKEQSQEFDDFDTKVQPEELPGMDDYDAMQDMDPEELSPNDNQETGKELSLTQDEDGNFFIFDKDGNMLANTK